MSEGIAAASSANLSSSFRRSNKTMPMRTRRPNALPSMPPIMVPAGGPPDLCAAPEDSEGDGVELEARFVLVDAPPTI